MPHGRHGPSSAALPGLWAGPWGVQTTLPLPPVPHGRVLLQRGAQRGDLLRQALQDRVLHLGLVGAVEALEGVGRIQGVNLGGAVGGRLEGCAAGGEQPHRTPRWVWKPDSTPDKGPEAGTGQPELRDAQGIPWAFGCRLGTLMPSPAPAPWHGPHPCVPSRVSRGGGRPPAHSSHPRSQAGNQRPGDEGRHAAPQPCRR